MLNYIWAFMIIIGIGYGALTGNMEKISNGALDSSKEAITLCITMLGVMSLWTGLMEIAKQSGLIKQLTRLISPFVQYMFPDIPKEHDAREHITTNIIANILGLGWAATPAGLRAMKSLSKLQDERSRFKPGIATNEMCTFLVINISSLQLIPVNIIAYRSQYGSVNPTAIVLPSIIATFISTIVGIVFCRIMCKK